jgi:nicotinic acid phosphoribosyltransferase
VNAAPRDPGASALLTDLYQLTMLQSYPAAPAFRPEVSAGLRRLAEEVDSYVRQRVAEHP